MEILGEPDNFIRFSRVFVYTIVEGSIVTINQERIPMNVVKAFMKNKWTYVIILALLALASGGVYSDQLTELIQSLLDNGV